MVDDSVKKTVSDLLRLMYAANGFGLAAPQVGINKRLMVFNDDRASRKSFEQVFINPVITGKSTTMVKGKEACLSFPLIMGDVERHEWVEVQYMTLEGETVKKRFTAYTAVIFQHEYDHLEKVCTLYLV